jgi:hypothetical protein
MKNIGLDLALARVLVHIAHNDRPNNLEDDILALPSQWLKGKCIQPVTSPGRTDNGVTVSV